MTAFIKARHLLVSAVAAGVFALPAYAQQSNSSGTRQMTVAEVLKKPVSDQEVQMQGHLLRQAEHDKYIFSDGTGEIAAQINSTHFPGLSFDAATKIVLVGGVVMQSHLPPEIKVKSARVLK